MIGTRKIVVATNPWKAFLSRLLVFLLCFPLSHLLALAGIIWFVSLGHIKFIASIDKWFEQALIYALFGRK